MDKIKLLKEEIEKIILEGQSSEDNRFAYVDGMISALANVLANSDGKEKFLRDYANGILHVADVLYGKEDAPRELEEYFLTRTNTADDINSIRKCKSFEEAEDLMRQQVREEMQKARKKLSYVPMILSMGSTEMHIEYKDNIVSWYKIHKI